MKTVALALLLAMTLPAKANATAAVAWYECREALIEVQTLNAGCVRMVNFYHQQLTGVGLFTEAPVHNRANDPLALSPDGWFAHLKACEAGYFQEVSQFENCKLILENLIKN